MQELPNFDHINTSKIEFELRGKIWLVMFIVSKKYDIVTLISIDFADIIKLAIMLIKKNLQKDSINIKRIRNSAFKRIFYQFGFSLLLTVPSFIIVGYL